MSDTKFWTIVFLKCLDEGKTVGEAQHVADIALKARRKSVGRVLW